MLASPHLSSNQCIVPDAETALRPARAYSGPVVPAPGQPVQRILTNPRHFSLRSETVLLSIRGRRQKDIPMDSVTDDAAPTLPADRAPATADRRADHEAHVATRRAALRRQVAEALAILGGHTDFVLEVGCGHGHFLTAYAQAHPSSACVGIDYANERISRAIRKKERAGVRNLCFLRAEALEFLSAVPDPVRFSHVFVLFPDPWPKKRHRKNRLMCGPFLNLVATLVRRDGDLYFRTDFQPHFDEVLSTVDTHPAWRLAADQSWDFDRPTVFQEKASTCFSARLVRNSSAR
jgi:tRNA (guanine-N7-)-methyltransferase